MGCQNSTPVPAAPAPVYRAVESAPRYDEPMTQSVPMAMAVPAARMRVLTKPGEVHEHAVAMGVPVPEYVTQAEIPQSTIDFFTRTETPLGLLNRLRVLTTFNDVSFVFDDSGSMQQRTDCRVRDLDWLRIPNALPDALVTRWEESHDRAHTLWTMICCCGAPRPIVSIRFLNNPQLTTLQPYITEEQGHDFISQAFEHHRGGTTPLLQAWGEDLRRAAGVRTLHVWATDGVPDGGLVSQQYITGMVLRREFPQDHPVVLLSCSNVEEETAWLRDLDGACRAGSAPAFVGEYDDYHDEAAQVMKAQGPIFPFTKGMYFVCMLVGALYPDDLDRLDERLPFSKTTLEDILGRAVAPHEYQAYLMQPQFRNLGA